MRVNELIVESQQLDAGPIGQAIGKGVGALAKGAGAVAGGIAGIPGAVKKGFQAGKSTVQGDEDPNAQPAGTAQQAAPAAPKQGIMGKIGQAVGDFKAGMAQGQDAAPAAGGAQPAAAPAAGGGNPLKQARAAVSQLDKQGKQNILKLLQKEFPQQGGAAKPAAAAPTTQAAAPATEPATAPAAEPAAAPTTQAAAPAVDKSGKTDAGLGKQSDGKFIFPGQKFDTNNGQPIGQPAAAPAAEPAPAADGKMTPQQMAAKKAELKGKRAAGKTAGTTASGFNDYTKAASSQRIVGANPDGSPKIQQIKAGKINTGNNLSEKLARKIELHKREMFENNLRSGQASIFVK